MDKRFGGLLGVVAVAAAGASFAFYNPTPTQTPTPSPTPTPSGSASAAVAAGVSGKFLHLSDIHYDVFADGLADQLIKLPADKWKPLLERSASKTPALTYRDSNGRKHKRDSNYALLKSSLTAASGTGPYDFVMYTGDYLPHGFEYKSQVTSMTPDERAQFAAKTVQFVNLMIEEQFPKATLVAALGNNDAGCGDYRLDPSGAFLKYVQPSMPGTKAAAARADFDEGGYYVTPHPTVPSTDIVNLSAFWSINYNLCNASSTADPGGTQVAWLGTALANVKSANRKAILAMHIAPGIDGYGGNPNWQAPPYEAQFEAVATKYSDILVGGYAGHSHMDEFRVLSQGATPYLAVRVGPAVTSWNGNAPSYTVFDYDTSDGSAKDYSVYSYRHPNAGGNRAWQFEYTFSQAYKLSRYNAANLATLAANIQASGGPGSDRETYLKYYNAKDQAGAGSTWQQVICATSFSKQSDFFTCVGKLTTS